MLAPFSDATWMGQQFEQRSARDALDARKIGANNAICNEQVGG